MQEIGNPNFSPYFVDLNESDQDRYFDRFDALPEKLLDLLLDEKTYNIVQSLNMEYLKVGPSNPEISKLIREVVLADTYIGDMPGQISSRLGIDANTAREVAKQIVSQLFAPAMEDLKKVQTAKFGKWPVPARPNFPPQNSGGQAGQTSQTVSQPPRQTEPRIYGNTVDLRGDK